MQDGQLLEAMPLNNWIILFTSRDQDKAEYFSDNLEQTAQKIGLRINSPMLYKQYLILC